MSKKYRAKTDSQFKKGMVISQSLMESHFEEVEEEKEIDEALEQLKELNKYLLKAIESVNELRRREK